MSDGDKPSPTRPASNSGHPAIVAALIVMAIDDEGPTQAAGGASKSSEVSVASRPAWTI